MSEESTARRRPPTPRPGEEPQWVKDRREEILAPYRGRSEYTFDGGPECYPEHDPNWCDG